jgi:hypothetical protein
MSSRFESLFAGLREQRPPAPFRPAEAVRRRGRQRAHRQAVSAGVAVLAVTGLGAGGLVVAVGAPDSDPPAPPASGSPSVESPSPSPPVSPSPARTELSPEWLLTADDLPGTGWTETGNELFESDPPWFWGCDGYRSEDAPSLRQRLDLNTASWINNESALRLRIDQVVDLFDSDESATTNVEDVRSATELCSWSPSDGGEEAGIEFAVTVTDENLAGDQAVLIEMRQYAFDGETIAPDPDLRFAAVIRVGNAVTTLISDDEQLPRDVAQLAAERLR